MTSTSRRTGSSRTLPSSRWSTGALSCSGASFSLRSSFFWGGSRNRRRATITRTTSLDKGFTYTGVAGGTFSYRDYSSRSDGGSRCTFYTRGWFS